MTTQTKIQEREAKSILVHSKLPGTDYVVNPYTGCEFSCSYCFASFMGRQVGESNESWGQYVYVKTNAVSLFEKELRRLSQEQREKTLLLSSVTDAYQGIEKTYRLTRGILQILVREQYPGLVGVLTKSPLVLDDLDLLQALPRVEVGMTITTTDDALSRFMEVRAPLASRRIDTLCRLHEAGIATYAFIGPLFPHFRYYPDQLEDLFAQVARTQVQYVFVEHINLSSYIKQRLWEVLKHEPPQVQEIYQGASTRQHQAILQEMVMELIKKYHLPLKMDTVISHKDDQAARQGALGRRGKVAVRSS